MINISKQVKTTRHQFTMKQQFILLLFVFFLCAQSGCQARHDATSAPIFAMDFSETEPLSAVDRVNRAENLAVVRDPVDLSNAVLRIDVDEGDHYGSSLHVDLKKHLGTEPTHLYFRYRIWFHSSWSTSTGGKLPGFNGTYSRAGWGGRPSDGSNGWSARGMFGGVDASGRIPVGSYIYHADMVEDGQQYGNGEWWDASLERERWYVIEQEIQLEAVDDDGGRADGWLRAWVDGELVFDRRSLHVRDSDDLRIESVWLNVFHGGKTPAPKSMHLLIDDLWIDLSRPQKTDITSTSKFR